MRVLISGSHGMIGTALRYRLQDMGHVVVRLVRSKPADDDIVWEPQTGQMNVSQLEGFDAVVHLGGANIGEKRWTSNVKQKIWDSRVVSTELLSKRLLEVVDRPSVLVSASAVGYYGNRGDEVLTEQSAQGQGFMAELCHMWEDATSPASEGAIRVVNIRSGIVLSKTGGALARQLPMFKLGIGGRLGSGTQWFPWISLRDEVQAIIHSLNTTSIDGPVNLVSPGEVTNAEFTIGLGKSLRRPTHVPAPRWMLALPLGAELTDQMLLASQRVRPEKLLNSGFQFKDVVLQGLFDSFFGISKSA